MPVWLAKLGLQVAMDPEKLIRILVAACFALVLVITLVFAVPILFFKYVPLGKTNQEFNYYSQAAQQIQQETGIFVNWQEIMAIDAVVLNQDFSLSSQAHGYAYKKYFVREEEVRVEQTCQRDVEKLVNGKKVIVKEDYDCSYTKTEYYPREFDDVLAMLVSAGVITSGQIEDVKRFLTIDLANVSLQAEGAGLSGDVMALEPLVRRYAVLNHIEDKVSLLLAMIQQESGGRIADVMQSSESEGLPRNSFTNPEDSIRQGVYYFSELLKDANGNEKIALQAYNFGRGFIAYALERGGYSKPVAEAFSQEQAQLMGWERYGDPDYVDHVLRYFSDILPPGDQIFDVNQVYQEMRKYLGVKYKLGGRNPDEGFVDCSGLMEFVFRKFGIELSGTAQDQYNKTKPVAPGAAQPGDLVFFYTGSDVGRTITHVGMYIGNDKFINANSKGVVESSVSAWSNYTDSDGVKYVFYGYRRIIG
jgi:cell wall-associated NlpC family hydrolase